MTTTDIAAKIAKVLAKAASTNSPAEAEALMAKVHQMLEQHGLDLLDVATLEADDPVGTSMGVGSFWASEGFAMRLAFNLGRYFGCRVVCHPVGNKRLLSVTGRESARVTFAAMFPFVMGQVRAAANRLVKEGHEQTRSRAMTSVGNALTIRLAILAWEAGRKDQARVDGGGRALVPVDMIGAAFEKEFPNTKAAARLEEPKLSRAGWEAAKDISLFKQTEGASEQLKLG